MGILSALRFNYLGEEESPLGKVDFGVLTVAMMVSALDGVITRQELAAFAKLAEDCRVSPGEKAAHYDAALHSAGYIMLQVRSGLSRKAITACFLAEAEKVLPMGFAGGRAEDIRRALVIWISMGLSDGEFSGVERDAIRAFCDRVAEIMQKRCDGQKERFWIGLCHGPFVAPKSAEDKKAGDAVETPDWMAGAEKVVLAGGESEIREFIKHG